MDTSAFIEKSKTVHGDKYNYDKVNYINKKTKVIITCLIHKEDFAQLPYHHTRGSGCQKCGKISVVSKQSMTTEVFIERAKTVHQDLYDYSLVNYINKYTKVKIKCNGCGAIFDQEAGSHLKGCGCKSCGNIKKGKSRRSSTETFIEKSKKIHSDKFDYSVTDYTTKRNKVSIRCIKHDLIFGQLPDNHLKRSLCCPKCVEEFEMPVRYTKEHFISAAQSIHKNENYDYSKTEYLGTTNKTIITCPKSGHGEFLQSYDCHVNKKQGCPKCCSSKGEKQIRDFLLENNIAFEEQKTFSDCRHKGLLKFDFYLPDLNTCIEFNGRQHYEQIDFFGDESSFEDAVFRDQIKHNYCIANSIKLITIPHYTDSSSLLSGLI